jgi:hypothetical protein
MNYFTGIIIGFLLGHFVFSPEISYSSNEAEDAIEFAEKETCNDW